MSTAVIPEKQASGGLKAEVRRVIRATRQRVYEAWTRPEEIQKWFGPASMTCPEAEAVVRVGGSYRITVTACDTPPGDETAARHTARGEYVRVVPNELLVFTWKPDWMPGEESLVTVRLRDVEGGTELTLTHEQFATAESCERHRQGWTSIMEKLGDYLEQ